MKHHFLLGISATISLKRLYSIRKSPLDLNFFPPLAYTTGPNLQGGLFSLPQL